ncbi:unnamed protein product [Gongylonema pulchrum]|uniref:G_PROTEIN_RECEP_F1_2 domain-containing protein n=1 Tax=Gongylonema pulchrum TaxID=637853 RepID=A0A183DIL4_9BILA|nr:unnamed protein product [Gongylonema pulchrum]
MKIKIGKSIQSAQLFQQYFSLSTCHRLRESLGIHLVIFGVLMIGAVLSPELLVNQVNWYCWEIPPSFQEHSDSYSLFSILSATVFVLMASFGTVLSLLSLITTIWEDFLRPWLLQCSLGHQLGLLQVIIGLEERRFFFFDLMSIPRVKRKVRVD